MLERSFAGAAMAAVLVGPVVAVVLITLPQARPAEGVPAFARQYDLQCNACHTRPPRLNRFGEQFHMTGFQIPSAARPDGLIGSLRDDGPVKTLIDSLALRIEGGLFKYTASPSERTTAASRSPRRTSRGPSASKMGRGPRTSTAR